MTAGCRVPQDTGLVKEDIPKSEIINKVGHALHFLDPVFTEYSQSDKVKQLVKGLGYKDPVLPQVHPLLVLVSPPLLSAATRK